MRTTARLLALALSLATASAPLVAEPDDSPRAAPERTRLDSPLEVPLDRARHLATVAATIDGRGPYRLAIDSGSAGAMSLTGALAAELGLEPVGEVLAGDPSGRNPQRRPLVRIDRLEIAGARFDGVIASVSDQPLPGATDGVIGLGVFSGLTVILDFPGGHLRLTRDPLPERGEHVVSYLLERGIPTIDVEAGGVPLHVDVDTGSPALLSIPAAWAGRLRFRGEPRVVGHARTASNEFDILGAELDGELTIAGWSLADPQVDLVDLFPVANVGARLLGRYALTFDTVHRRLALVAGGPGPDPAATPPAAVAPALEETARDLVAALAAGDSARWEALAQQRFAPSVLQRHTAEERQELFARLRDDVPEARLLRLEPTGPWSADAVLASRGGGGATLHLALEPQPPHRVGALGIEVRQGGEPPAALPRPLPELIPDDPAALSAVLDPYLRDLGAKNDFSGVVLVARDGRPLFERASGVADFETGAANTPGTRFNIASIGKLLTRVAIGQLLQQGKLSLDDRVAELLPSYPDPEAAAKFTVDQLLEHRAGVPDIFDVVGPEDPAPQSNRDWYERVAPRPLLFEPGSQTRYCNGCYVVLGEIVAALSGTTYERYLAEHVLRPAGMDDTAFLAGDRSEPRKARGYSRQDGPLAVASLGPGGRGSGAGGIYSTVGDLLRLDEAIRTYRLLDRTHTSWLLDGGDVTGARASGGLGVAGGAPGTNAVLESDGTWTVVVLTNRDPRLGETLGTSLARALRR